MYRPKKEKEMKIIIDRISVERLLSNFPYGDEDEIREAIRQIYLVVEDMCPDRNMDASYEAVRKMLHGLDVYTGKKA